MPFRCCECRGSAAGCSKCADCRGLTLVLGCRAPKPPAGWLTLAWGAEGQKRAQQGGSVQPLHGRCLTGAGAGGAAQAFLSLCQGNHYQFDSMRRAKHSSMMVLYHLHNPDAPAFVCTCNACGVEIEPGQGFCCTVCQDFDMCANCRMTAGHPHPLAVRQRPSLQACLCLCVDVCTGGSISWEGFEPAAGHGVHLPVSHTLPQAFLSRSLMSAVAWPLRFALVCS